jgi:hypothetical protein
MARQIVRFMVVVIVGLALLRSDMMTLLQSQVIELTAKCVGKVIMNSFVKRGNVIWAGS